MKNRAAPESDRAPRLAITRTPPPAPAPGAQPGNYWQPASAAPGPVQLVVKGPKVNILYNMKENYFIFQSCYYYKRACVHNM